MQRRDVLRWGAGISAATAGLPVLASRASQARIGSTTDLEGGFGRERQTPRSNRVAWTTALASDEPSVLGTTDACFVNDSSGLTAYDATSGERQWSNDVPTHPFRVAGDGLFVLDGGLAELDATTGEERWTADLPRRAFEFCFDDERAYYADREGPVVAIDRETGREAWRDRVHDDTFGFTLAVEGDLVAFGTDDGVFAYDAASGERRWRNTRGVTAETVTSNAVFVGTDAEVPGAGVERLDSNTGEREWRYEIDTRYDNGLGTYGTHAFGETVFATYNGVVTRVDPESGEEVWRAPIDSGFVGTHFVEGVVDDALVVQVQGELTAIDVASGDVRWRKTLADVRGIHRDGFLDVELAAGTVFATDRDGVRAFHPATGRVRWTTELGERTIRTTSGELDIAHPIDVAGEHVLASRGERLFAYRANVEPSLEVRVPDEIDADVEVTFAARVRDAEAEYDPQRTGTSEARNETTTGITVGTEDGSTSSDTAASVTEAETAESTWEPRVPDGVEVEWRIDGEVVGSGATLERAFARGEYELAVTATDAVGAETTEERTLLVGDPITTTAAPTPTATETRDAAEGSPGFGVLAAGASALAAGYALVRHRPSDRQE